MTVEATNDIDVLSQWIGKSQTLHDTMRVDWARFMQQTLDQAADANDGEPLPPLWHYIYFLESAQLSRLGRDGHPQRGGFLPPVLLPRRMWAGSRLDFLRPLPIGAAAEKVATIQNIEMKSGSTGDLCFVTVRHETSVDGTVCVREEQDLVFREDPDRDTPARAPKPAPDESDWNRTIVPSEVQLFRLSALTFNAHRIHYDRDYARDVEGYPGLVFHGPVTATHLAALARDEGGELATFSFRGTAPLFDTAPFSIHGNRTSDGADLWARTPEGGIAMIASATFRE